jgi:hypothetical protein
LQTRLARAEAIIDVQKKVAHLLGTEFPSLPPTRCNVAGRH